MKLDQLSIGQMAQLNRVSEQTLRLYDRMGLLKPSQINENNRYRYYTIGQSAVLDTIQYYKHMGMSLSQIQNELEHQSTDSMRQMLRRRQAEVESEIETLLLAQKSIQRSLDNYDRYVSMPSVGQIFMEYMGERKILVFHGKYDVLENDYSHYEYNLRLFKNHLMDIGFPMSLFCNTGTMIRKKALTDESFRCNEFYVLTNDFPWPQDEIEVVPAGIYLSICCVGFDMEHDFARLLLEEVKKHHFSVAGDYLCEVIYDFPNTEKMERQFFYKIQIPIQ
ncbi:MAG: transcriptional regulator, MerR family [Oscillospiraceae bacterium]|nr:transcriptional regulator, MerR family [Oscillospiraceae bacterium]